MAATSGGPRHNGASQQVMTYLRDHANTVIPYPELHKAIGAQDKFTVPNAITHLIAKGMPIYRPMRGFAIYKTEPVPLEIPEETPEEAPGNKYWEFVGNSDKVVIVRGEDDELYVIKPLSEYLKGE